MAVTSIWDIKGRVDQVINYARNPEKTTEESLAALASLHAIGGVVEYAANDMKTERRAYVTGVNCDPDNAAKEFMETKRHWRKLDGITAFHGYQSFKPGEVDAKTAHEIGVRLAEELWGDRFEVVVATHLNTNHCHNHFVLNSVSFADGLRYYDQKKTYYKMREVSDRLCREYRLSVIENPGRSGKHYSEWQAEQNGKPTHKGSIRADIDRAILASTTERDFIRVMGEMGYSFKTRTQSGAPLKYPALKPPGAKGYFRFHKLGEGYALEQVRERILRNIRKQIPFPEAERKPPRRYRYRGAFPPQRKLTGLRALYFRYCYELRIIVKRPTSVKRVSFLLREDVAKLDQLIAQTRFLGRAKIDAIEELNGYREKTASEMEALTADRQALRNQLRRLYRQEDQSATEDIKRQIAEISGKLKTLRREVKLCDGIAERSGQIRENLTELAKQKETERKERSTDELFRRRGGTGRADESGGR